MNVAPVRVAIVDDQDLVRSGLQELLGHDPRIEVPLCLAGGAELLAGLSRKAVDVVLADIRMPGMDGFELVTELRARNQTVPVLLLTTFDEEDLLLQAARCGAQGFMLKDASTAELVDALLRLHQGESVFTPIAAAAIRHRFRPDRGGEPAVQLGARELAILRLLAGGYSNKEIARTIHLSEGTIKNYVSDILQKLGVRDRTRAVLKAITRGLI